MSAALSDQGRVVPIYVTQHTAGPFFGFGGYDTPDEARRTRRRFLDFVRANGVAASKDGQTVFVRATDLAAAIERNRVQVEANVAGAGSLLDALGLEVAE